MAGGKSQQNLKRPAAAGVESIGAKFRSFTIKRQAQNSGDQSRRCEGPEDGERLGVEIMERETAAYCAEIQ